MRYRLMSFQRPAGCWRDTKEEAQQDAVNCKLAYYDEDRDMIFMGPAVWIGSKSA